MTECERYRQLVWDRLDGLSSDDDVEAHLAGCEVCRRYLVECEALHELALAEPVEEPPVVLKQGVMVRLRARQVRVSRGFFGFVVGEALAAVALAVLLFCYGPPLPSLGTLNDPASLTPSSSDVATFVAELCPSDAAATVYPAATVSSLVASADRARGRLSGLLTDGPTFTSLLLVFATLLIATLAANLYIVHGNGLHRPERTAQHVR